MSTTTDNLLRYTEGFADCTTKQETDSLRKAMQKRINEEIDSRAIHAEASKRISQARIERNREIRKELDDKTHEMVSDWQPGEKIYFDPINSSSMTFPDLNFVDNYNNVTEGIVHRYQPRKRILWMSFTKDQVSKSQWEYAGRSLQPFRLADIREHNGRRTDV